MISIRYLWRRRATIAGRYIQFALHGDLRFEPLAPAAVIAFFKRFFLLAGKPN